MACPSGISVWLQDSLGFSSKTIPKLWDYFGREEPHFIAELHRTGIHNVGRVNSDLIIK